MVRGLPKKPDLYPQESGEKLSCDLRRTRRSGGGWTELTNMACLTEEVGELARVMARRYGDQSFKEGENCNLEEEMADVLWVLICLANQTGVNLTEALRKSIEKKTRRDKERHINNPKLH